jgi:flagellar hook-length control protein FliK
VAEESAATSTANEDAESKDEPTSDDRQSMAAAAAIVMPAIVENELPQAAQAAEGTEETGPSDAAAAERPKVHAISIAGADTDHLPVAALAKPSPSSPDEQPRGLAAGQADRTFRSAKTTHPSEIGENPEFIVPRGSIGDEVLEGNERGEDRDSLPSAQHFLEIPTGAADGLESLHTEVENTSPADATTPIAQSGESGVTQNSAASAPHWLAARLPPELLAAATGRQMPQSQASEVESGRLIQRVARAFTAVRDGGEVRLRLSPPELGALRLEIKVEGSAVIAHIEAETPAARTALIENLPALRERLAELGVRIERFDVDLMKRGDERAFDRPANQPRQDHASQPHLPPRDRRLPQVADGVVARTTIVGDLDQRRLNVLV